jgi:hypothetical protein
LRLVWAFLFEETTEEIKRSLNFNYFKNGGLKMKYQIKNIMKILLISMVFILNNIPHGVQASLVIKPSDDGSIYSGGSVDDTEYLLTSGSIQGVTIFSTSSIVEPVSQALLSVNPYGLPLYGPSVQVYGFESNTGMLTSTDYNAGTFIGNWVLPSNLGYGQNAYFNLTQYLSTVTSPYVGFGLRTPSGETDVFSSLNYNYGQPDELTVTPTPIPAAVYLLGSSLMGLYGFKRRKA